MGLDLSRLFTDHIIHIYFLYGLSFFSMGVALLAQPRPESQLTLARASRLFGWFGLLHGANEFVEMGVIANLIRSDVWMDLARLGLLAVSFLPLAAFGLALLPKAETSPRFVARLTLLAGVAFAVQVGAVYAIYQPPLADWILAAETLARYTLAIPASALVGYGLWRQRVALSVLGMRSYSRDMAAASLAMALYGVIGQAFAKPSLVFPSALINASLFLAWSGFPIQLFRAAMALVAALSMFHALRVFEDETRRRLRQAVEAQAELQMAARELSLLYETSTLLTSTYDLETLTQKAVERIVPIIDPVKRAAIYVGETAQRQGRLSACGYPREDLAELGSLLANHVRYGHDSQSLYWVDSEGKDVSQIALAHTADERRSPPLAIRRVVIPLRTKERMVGSLLIETDPRGPFLSSLEAPTIIALGRQLAIAIDYADVLLQLRQREALQSELLQRATNAQEGERARIARELHDDTGQALTALALGLRGVSNRLRRKSSPVAQDVAQLEAISARALAELRRVISDLRPSHLDDLGLVAALRWQVEDVRSRTQTQCSLQVSGDEVRLPPEVEIALFRVAQEALGNTLKHASAAHAWVSLAFEPRRAVLRIQDDGRGFDCDAALEPGARRAWGLIGMQERVALMGGRFAIESSPGAGSMIQVEAPINPPAKASGNGGRNGS